MTRTDNAILQIEVPLQAEYVAVARLAIFAYASRLLADDEQLDDIVTAVGEAYTHALTYAYVYEGQAELPYLILHCRYDPQVGMTISVQHARGRCNDAGTWQHQGPFPIDHDLSLLLAKLLMDDVTLKCSPESGLELIMVKAITVSEEHATAMREDVQGTTDQSGGRDVRIAR